jgi:hypothetical protein
VKTVAAVLLTALAVLAGRAATGQPALETDLELVLAVDASGSVNTQEFNLQLDGIAAGLRDRSVLEAIRSGPNGRIAINLLVWAEARWPKDMTGWLVIADADDAERAAGIIEDHPRRLNGGTGLGDGLASSLRSITGNSIRSLRQVVDISGDGRETTPREFSVLISQARAMAVARGVTVNGLAILNEDAGLADYYRNQVQVGPGSFTMSAADYDDFAESMRRKLLREISYHPVARSAPARPAPAQHVQMR